VAEKRIKLTRYESTSVNVHYISAYRLKIIASDASGLENRVFLFRRDAINPYTSEATDTFVAVCSPVDLEDYPPAEPDPAKEYPFFRADTVEVDFRTTAMAEEVWLIIKKEVCTLLEGLDRLETLKLKEEVWCGTPPDESDSSASSDSA